MVASEDSLRLVEAQFLHRFLPQPYFEFQLRMYNAQVKCSATMLTWLKKNSGGIKKLDNMKKFAAKLLTVACHDAIQCRPHLWDAIMYRVAFVAAYAAYYPNTPAEANSTFKALAELVDQQQDVNSFLDDLTAASERHLARVEDRSSLWLEQTSSTAVPAVPAVPATSASKTKKPVEKKGLPNQPASKPVPEVHSEEYLAEKARKFVFTHDNLPVEGQITPWDELDCVSEAFKRQMKSRRVQLLLRRSSPVSTPPGVLFHGVGGCGKTECVYSWCKHIKGTLIKIEMSIEGWLKGHTQK